MFSDPKYRKLFEIMKLESIECTIVGPSGDMQYLIGFNPGGCERFQALFILADGRHFYISNVLYYEDMHNALSNDTRFYLWKDNEGWFDCVKQAFEDYQLDGKKIALSNSIRAVDLVDMQNLFTANFVNGNAMLENYRAVKSWDNIDDMRKAAYLADEVMVALTQYIKPGITEKNIQEKIIELFTVNGADGISFTPIVASGANNSRPHYVDNSRVITEKDVIVLDFGCKVNGYCSDTSRTFFVGGLTEKEKEIYDIVKEAYQAAADFAKEGVKACDVDKKARDIIEAAGYGENFLNRTGHGIGYDVHEAPYINGNNSQILEKGMAFSIEPGIYIAGEVGMRIEDIVVINEDGKGEAINHFTKDYIIL